jgi:hypothetical protein
LRIIEASRAGRKADDLAALDQERMHRRVDAIDLGPQRGKRGDVLFGLFRHVGLVNDSAA